MKTHTQGFENEIKTMGRQQSVLISFNDETLTGEDVNSVTFTYEGALLKSIMKELIIDSNEPIAVETLINFQYGLLVNGDYEYLDYGNFVVYEVQKKEDTNSYEIKCYDKMLYAMQEYEPITANYPTTILFYLTKLCNRLGYSMLASSFTNFSKPMPSDLYIGLGYTYRDVLDELAEVLGCTFYIKDTGTPTLVISKPANTNKTLNEEWFKDINVNFGEKFGPVNAIVLSRSAESDNVYIRDEDSITANGLTEIKIIDNQIMNFNNRSDYLQGLADSLFGLEYYLNDYSSTGIMFFDPMDVYNVSIGGNTYKCMMLNDEQNITQGLEENIYAERPEQNETDYTKADKTDQRINQTYLIVDKQNQTIESVVSEVTEQNQKLVVMQQSINEIDAKISDIADITTSDSTTNGTLIMENINESEPIKIVVHPTGMAISELIASEGTIIGENTIIKSRTLRFTNTETDEVWNYILPDDLFYYDSENYDEFTLEYDGEICQVEKKCKLENGQVVLLDEPVITNYQFPHIPLTTGDYTIELVGYVGYIFARLMATNMYTEQFATKVEMTSEINQKATEITAEVNETLTGYVTTSQMNSAINLTKSEINASVTEVSTRTETAQSTADGATLLATEAQTIANNAIQDAQDTNTALTGLGESIGDLSSQITDLQEITTTLTTKSELQQTADSFEASITQTTETLTTTINGTQSEISEIKNYIHYDIQDTTGTLTLGKTNNPYTLQLTNHELKINENDNTVAYFDEDSMQVTNGVFNTSLAIGNFEFRPETNGSLSFTRRIS